MKNNLNNILSVIEEKKNHVELFIYLFIANSPFLHKCTFITRFFRTQSRVRGDKKHGYELNLCRIVTSESDKMRSTRAHTFTI